MIASVLFEVLIAVALAAGFTAQASAAAWDVPPDEVFEAPSAYVVPANTGDSVHQFEIASSQMVDRWIRGFDFHPGDGRVVQSAWIYVKKTGQWLGGWIPGQDKMIAFPEGVAAQLPAGSSIVMEVHYKALGEDVPDRSELGLYFANVKPLRPLTGMSIESKVLVPPAQTPFQVRKEFTIISDSYAIALRPEMQAAGRSLLVTTVDPSGESSVLLQAPEHRDDSQIPYMLSQPRFLPKGTRIVATALYENPTNSPLDDLFRLSVALYPSSDVRIVADPKPGSKAAASKKAPVKKKPASQP